jgi:hypothetical protein
VTTRPDHLSRRRDAPIVPPAGDHLSRRRALLLAVAGAALVRPAAAIAATDAEPAVLLRLVAREDAAAFAYRQAAPEPLPAVAAQEADHARALRTHLDALGRKAPGDAALDPAARRLAEASDAGRVDAAIALEASLVEDYSDALGELAEPGVLQTAATILASHAQHHARLRHAAGRDPFG